MNIAATQQLHHRTSDSNRNLPDYGWFSADELRGGSHEMSSLMLDI